MIGAAVPALDPPLLAWLAVALVLSVWFSGTQTALLTLNKADRQVLFATGAGRLLNDRVEIETTVLIGNVLTSVTVAALGTAFILDWAEHGAPWLPWLLAIAALPVLVLAPEVLAKAVGYRFNRTWTRLALWPIALLHVVLTPVRRALRAIVMLLAQPLRLGPEDTPGKVLETEILNLIEEGAEAGTVAVREREIIEAVFDFGELTVGRLMTPRPDMFAVPLDIPYAELLDRCREQGYSRVPVYSRRTDDIVGVLLLKDLLRHRAANPGPNPPSLGPHQLRSLLIPPVFVPQTKPANAMLREFLARKQHIAFVVDEHGTLVGLITLDDLLTELVGEFLDQEEAAVDMVVEVEPGVYRVKAWLDVEDFAEETQIAIPRDGYHTVGGFVFHQLGRLPHKGDSVRLGTNRFVVSIMEGRRISEVVVQSLKEAESAEPQASATP